MTDIALYPGDRGSGKTTMLMQQVWQAAHVGQTVLVVVPTGQRQLDLSREMKSWTGIMKMPWVVCEPGIDRSRGLRPDCVFIDDADLFQDDPIKMLGHFQPGVPLTVTYTPWSGHVLDTEPVL
jgi:thymidine kinase